MNQATTILTRAEGDDTTLVLPARQGQFTVLAFPALSGVGPAGLAEQTADVALDVLRELELEQVGLIALFQRGHQQIVAEGVVAAHQPRFLLRRQRIKQLEQPRLGMPGRMLVAGADFDAEHLAQSGHQVGVIRVRGASRFLRVVAQERTLLMPVEHLDGRVAIENPRGIEQWRHTVDQMTIQPRNPFRLRNALQGIAQGVFGDHFPHAEQSRVDAVAAHCRHMRVAPMPGQHRQQPGAQHFRLRRRIGAGVGEWTAFQPARPQPGQVEKLDEVGQLPQRRGGTLGFPTDLHSPRHRLHARTRHEHFFACQPLQFRLTHRVTPSCFSKTPACLISAHFAHR